ncbi:MAG: hypothetical protein AAF236_10480 [Verrucomicrobiota bacterium]
MSCRFRVLMIALGLGLGASAGLPGQEAGGAETTPVEQVLPPGLTSAGELKLTGTGDGQIPSAASRKAGTWAYAAASQKLQLKPEPLVEGWLEFGSEIREKSATITAVVESSGEGRLESWIGIGLFGKNGFQIRGILNRDRVELIRRSETIIGEDFVLEPGQAYQLELSTHAESSRYRVEARVWPADGERPEEPLLVHETDAETLLFPLAGRGVLVGVPFSREPVAFSEAQLFHGVIESGAE